MSKLLEYNATLVERTEFEPGLDLFRVRLDAPNPQPPWFVPGQYVTLGLNGVVDPTNDLMGSVRRPMSIASSPFDVDVEFYIRRVATSDSALPLTHLLWELAVGDRVYCRANPTGRFTVPDTVGVADQRLKVLAAAGTGLAPFMSMVRERVHSDPNASLEDVAILHGASRPAGLGYRAELEALARDHGLKYIPTVSRPGEAPGWTGRTGRVEALLSPEGMAQTEASLGLGSGQMVPDKAVVLICGLVGTINQIATQLLSRRFIPNHRRLRRALQIDAESSASVFWEQYDSEPVVNLKDQAVVASLAARYRGEPPEPL